MMNQCGETRLQGDQHLEVQNHQILMKHPKQAEKRAIKRLVKVNNANR